MIVFTDGRPHNCQFTKTNSFIIIIHQHLISFTVRVNFLNLAEERKPVEEDTVGESGKDKK